MPQHHKEEKGVRYLAGNQNPYSNPPRDPGQTTAPDPAIERWNRPKLSPDPRLSSRWLWQDFTLLSEWITGGGIQGRCAWVSLDEGDSDVVRFWSYTIAALQTLEPAIGQTALGVLPAVRRSPPS